MPIPDFKRYLGNFSIFVGGGKKIYNSYLFYMIVHKEKAA